MLFGGTPVQPRRRAMNAPRSSERRSLAAMALLLFAAAQAGCYIQLDPYLDTPPQPEAAGAAGAVAAPAEEQAGEASVADFQGPLSAYGDWVDAPPYGRVWVPREDVVGAEFVPYSTGGQWVSTDTGW